MILPACPACGKPLPGDAPHGLCPHCLLAGELESRADTGTSTGESMGRPGSFQPPSLEEMRALFPHLEITELLGQGGMGAVYKARQPQLDRLVALKVLPPGVKDDPSFGERFVREARALAKLNHPQIVTLYEFGQTEGRFYFLMEYVDGVSLGRLLRNSRVSPREALAIVPQICDALQYAHDRGIVHRDIKPDNILLSREGQVKIADFGVAKIVGANLDTPTGADETDKPGLTRADSVLGTPQYMAPEQMEQPLQVDHRADIYALGVVFYQMLTGEMPKGPLEPPSRKVTIDVRLDEVVLRALDAQPERRYQQASQLREQVESISAELEQEGRHRRSRLPLWLTILRWTARILGTLMAVLVGLFVIGEGLPPIGGEGQGIQLNFLGLGLMVLGGILGWKHEGAAALLLLSGWVVRGVGEGRLELGFFIPFVVTGLIYTLFWWGTHRRNTRRVLVIAIALAAAFVLGRWLVPTSVWVEGTITDAKTGAGISEVSVYLEGMPKKGKAEEPPAARTNRQGRFLLYVDWYTAERRITLVAPGHERTTVELGPKPSWPKRVQREYEMQPAPAAGSN